MLRLPLPGSAGLEVVAVEAAQVASPPTALPAPVARVLLVLVITAHSQARARCASSSDLRPRGERRARSCGRCRLAIGAALTAYSWRRRQPEKRHHRIQESGASPVREAASGMAPPGGAIIVIRATRPSTQQTILDIRVSREPAGPAEDHRRASSAPAGIGKPASARGAMHRTLAWERC